MREHPHPAAMSLLHGSTQRLVRTVDALTADDLAGDSLLPGWTRGHVVAHLALNAEGLGRVLDGVVHDRPATMYDSNEARDTDISDLAGAGPGDLRERLLAATTLFAEALAAMPEDAWAGDFERTPGGQVIPVGAVPLLRWREVEVHHADLLAGYTSDDWPEEHAVAVLDSMRGRDWPAPFRLLARDLARTWEYGSPEDASVPTITGASRDLAWWVTGRGDGATLSSDHDQLPEVPPW